jgi:hypothetical protein
MATFDFSPARAAASMAEVQPAAVPVQSPPMQIDADAVCLVNAVSADIAGINLHEELVLGRTHGACLKRPASAQSRSSLSSWSAHEGRVVHGAAVRNARGALRRRGVRARHRAGAWWTARGSVLRCSSMRKPGWNVRFTIRRRALRECATTRIRPSAPGAPSRIGARFRRVEQRLPTASIEARR